jgi:hypothetical protein
MSPGSFPPVTQDPTIGLLAHWLWGIGSAAVGAFFAALIGAWGAREIARRVEARNEILQEIRSINLAIYIAHGIANTLLTIKEQHLQQLREQLGQDRLRFAAHLQGFRDVPQFVYERDFELMTPPALDTRALNDLLMSRINATGAILVITQKLIQTAHSLNDAIIVRNNIIGRLRVDGPDDDLEFAYIYFGIRDSSGNIDGAYHDSVRNIYFYTDYCIVFGVLLIEALHRHGVTIRTKYLRRHRQRLPIIAKVDWKSADAAALMPSRAGYPDYQEQFRDVPTTRKQPLWQFYYDKVLRLVSGAYEE